MKDRIHSTYMYLAGSVGLTALSALAVSRTPILMNFMMRGSWVVSKLDFVFLFYNISKDETKNTQGGVLNGKNTLLYQTNSTETK